MTHIESRPSENTLNGVQNDFFYEGEGSPQNVDHAVKKLESVAHKVELNSLKKSKPCI